MGIWNVSPDSFSSHFDCDAASCEHALQLCKDGADIIDIGAESTRPGAAPISADEEINRLKTPLEWAKQHIELPVSLDSRHPQTIQWALSHQYVELINDIGASETPCHEREGRIYAAVRDAGCHLIVMAWNDHNAPILTFDECLKKIIIQLKKRVEFAVDIGVDPGRIIVDPGIGFGKGLENDIKLISHAPEALKCIGCPVLIAHSRKRCIAGIAGKNSHPDTTTAIASAIAFAKGASIVRVHQPVLSVIAKKLIS